MCVAATDTIIYIHVYVGKDNINNNIILYGNSTMANTEGSVVFIRVFCQQKTDTKGDVSNRYMHPLNQVYYLLVIGNDDIISNIDIVQNLTISDRIIDIVAHYTNIYY